MNQHPPGEWLNDAMRPITWKNELIEIANTLSRVRSAGYALPAFERLLEYLNERLGPIVDLNPLTELSAAGLTVAEWLVAVELRRQIIVELIKLEA